LTLDENIPLLLASLLEQKGIIVSSVYSQKLSGMKDKELITHCKEQKYILITLDNDFSNTVLYPSKNYEGIIVIRTKDQSVMQIMKLIEKFLLHYKLEDTKNKTIIIEYNQIKVRE